MSRICWRQPWPLTTPTPMPSCSRAFPRETYFRRRFAPLCELHNPYTACSFDRGTRTHTRYIRGGFPYRFAAAMKSAALLIVILLSVRTHHSQCLIPHPFTITLFASAVHLQTVQRRQYRLGIFRLFTRRLHVTVSSVRMTAIVRLRSGHARRVQRDSRDVSGISSGAGAGGERLAGKERAR